MKIHIAIHLIINVFFFTYTLRAQSDSLPILIDLKVKKEYVIKTSVSDPFIASYMKRNSVELTTDSVSEKYFDVSVEIKNTSKKKITIILMNCSWEDNFLINNNYIDFKGHDCDRNFPSPVRLDPGESRAYQTTLIKSLKFDYPCKHCIYGPQVEATKLGLIVLEDVYDPKLNVMNYDLAMNDKSKWRIVWSKPIYLLSSEEASPDPTTIEVLGND